MNSTYWAEQDNDDNNIVHIYHKTTMSIQEYRKYHDPLLIVPLVLKPIEKALPGAEQKVLEVDDAD